ncbi:MAG: [FeFe] hydrogenase H-cluster radical SAM maturase HydE [Clostridiales bacterium]|jgi:biotin synthase|nr:[FeFe] hydrogenase H-cluster radical SAM maturase HydE [Clostridiales bacterium]
MNGLIDKLYHENTLSGGEFAALIKNRKQADAGALFAKAREVSKRRFGNGLYIRGLIEFSNYCGNDCHYCGIRRGNRHCERYRLSADDILQCCANGYALGFRTFVLQSGEDGAYSDGDLADIVVRIRKAYPDCAITLSIGEKSYEAYQRFFESGADRYLLRHETANAEHYAKLHPAGMSLANRKQCLYHLKQLGYQVGTGFMVGSPYQTAETLAEDLTFIKELDPQMVGIGPFLPHKDTRFAEEKAGSLELTLFLIGVLRLMLPNALIPATTAVGTVDARGREQAVLAGANVLMPNLSPVAVRKKYLLYDNKICTGEEAAECRDCLRRRMESIGYRLTVGRGDYSGE